MWVIDVALSKSSPDTTIAIFLPRAGTTPDGTYTAKFNGTFRPSNFPCSTVDTTAKAATTCCLADFVAFYHVVTSFVVPTSTACVSPYAAPPILNVSDAVTGTFGADMPASSIAMLPSNGRPAGVSVARISVGAADMRMAASQFSGQAAISESMVSFVGLAQFVPVPGSRLLDSSVTQVNSSMELCGSQLSSAMMGQGR